MRRVSLFVLVFTVLVSGSASALTLRDLIELSRAGLGDEVLLALIEVDRPVFAIDTAALKSLKAAGLSERVMVAVVRSGRVPSEPPVAAAPPQEPDVSQEAPAPQVIIVEHHDAQPQVREVAVPVFIPVMPITGRGHDRADRGPADREIGKGTAGRSEPVYWGWGGKRRPDSWDDRRDKDKQDK